MKEANLKNDFLKAIGGHKPTEVYRVHADIGNNKVGITGWYTKAVIDDVVEDIKNRGVKILKIEKSTDPKHLNESLNESPLVDVLVTLLGSIGGPILLYFIGKLIKGLINTAVDVRNIVAPPKYIKFLKGLEDNDKFNKQFMNAVGEKGGMSKMSGGSLFDISRMITKLPEFDKAFEEFCKEEGVDDKDAKKLKSITIGNMAKAIAKNTPETIKMLKKKYPDEVKKIMEGGLGGQFSVAQLENLRKEYSSLDKKVVTESQLREIARTLAGIPTEGLSQLSGAGIAVLSPLAEIVVNEKKKTI